MKTDAEGFAYPKIDTIRCTDCGICKTACFVTKQRSNATEYEIYAAKNKDDNIRYQSSSGGIFTLLAEAIIEQGGVVFGAEFDENFAVRHNIAHTKEELRKFRKSKYIQSNVGNTFAQAKEYLELGKEVLFSGTPCHIAGLKAFLNKDYDGLHAIDLICTGVSSPKVWNMYLFALQEKMKSKIQSVTLRDKEIDNSVLASNQRNLTVKILFENGEQIYQITGTKQNENPFFQGFLENIYLRPSCYKCAAKGFTSGSDIQLGDFWGIDRIYPEFCDKYKDGTVIPFGLSEVIVVSEKGKNLFEKIRNKAIAHKLDIVDETEYNWYLANNSVKLKPNRNAFFAELPNCAGLEVADLIRKHILGFDIKILIERRKNNASLLVLFGADKIGEEILSLFKSFDCNIDYFCDNKQELWGSKVEEIPVISPKELKALYQKTKVTVFISCCYYMEISTQLEELGIQFFNKVADYDRLKEAYFANCRYSTLRDWLYKKQISRSMDKYLKECEYKEIAIYGMGEIGQLFFWEMQNSEIKVKYAIDKNADRIFAEVPVLKPDSELPRVDALVVCVPFIFEAISQNMAEKIAVPIISINKLIFEA